MDGYFGDNPAVKAEFDKLPLAVRNAIVESGIRIGSVEELNRLAKEIISSMNADF